MQFHPKDGWCDYLCRTSYGEGDEDALSLPLSSLRFCGLFSVVDLLLVLQVEGKLVAEIL